MITNKEIYGLHTSVDSEPSELSEAYRDVPLDSRDESRKNNTPLHTACHFADMTAVEILLERGADANVKNDDSDTPLCVMARRGPRPDDADIAGLLLSKGARVPRSGKDTTALIEAVRNRNFQMADVLLTSGNRIDSTDRSGRNVLHVICLSAGLIADEIRRTEGFFPAVVLGQIQAGNVCRTGKPAGIGQTMLPHSKTHSGKRTDRPGRKGQHREDGL